MSFWNYLAGLWLFNRIFGAKKHGATLPCAPQNAPGFYNPRTYADDMTWAADDPDLEPDELETLADDYGCYGNIDGPDEFDFPDDDDNW